MHRTPATRNALRRTAALTLCACATACFFPERIDRIEQATRVPTHHRVQVTAQSVPQLRGVAYSIDAPATGRPGPEHHRETWAVPLVDPGGEIGPDRTVYAWVMPPAPVRRGADPQPWLDALRAELDGKPQALVAIGHAEHPASRDRGFRDAITDAERRHRLRSHPDAPVFRFPQASAE